MAKKKEVIGYSAEFDETLAFFKSTNPEFAQFLVEFADDGADIEKIFSAIGQVPSKWEWRSGIFDLKADLSEVSSRNEKARRNAFTLLTERLKPVFPETLIGQSINSEIAKMQAVFQQSWGDPAMALAERRKGDIAHAEGKIQYDEWTDKDGQKRTSTKILCFVIEKKAGGPYQNGQG